MRVLIDANILLRTLLPSTNPHRAVDVILRAALSRAFTLLVPPDLVEEVREKARTKPYLIARIPPERINRFMLTLGTSGEALAKQDGPFPRRCPDPKDDYLFAYADVSQADFLLSGDNHVLRLDSSAFPFAIVSPSAFLAVLRARGLLPEA